MVDQSIIKIIQNYITEAGKAGVRISDAFLFGSYARDKQNIESDLDLAVICPDLDEDTTQEIVDVLWEIRMITDSRIEPVPIGQQAWSSGSGGIIADIVRNEGIRIPLALSD
jgi:predicted nucleotidyltransferase